MALIDLKYLASSLLQNKFVGPSPERGLHLCSAFWLPQRARDSGRQMASWEGLLLSPAPNPKAPLIFSVLLFMFQTLTYSFHLGKRRGL